MSACGTEEKLDLSMQAHYFDIQMDRDVPALGQNVPFSFSLFQTDQLYTGTYRSNRADEVETNVLIPCAVDEVGQIVGEGEKDVTCGLYAPQSPLNYPYVMAVVSPALKPKMIVTETGESQPGFRILRHPDVTKTPDFFLGRPIEVSLWGIALDVSYIYQVRDTLRTPRAKLMLTANTKFENTSYTIEAIKIQNTLKEAYYNPMYGYLLPEDAIGEISPYANGGACVVDQMEPNPIAVDPAHEASPGNIYLIADDYTEPGVRGVPLLHVVIRFGSKTKVVELPLEYHFKRSHTYKFNLMLSSTLVELTALEGQWTEDWEEDADDSDGIIETLSTVVYDLSDMDWEEEEDSETIGD